MSTEAYFFIYDKFIGRARYDGYQWFDEYVAGEEHEDGSMLFDSHSNDDFKDAVERIWESRDDVELSSRKTKGIKMSDVLTSHFIYRWVGDGIEVYNGGKMILKTKEFEEN